MNTNVCFRLTELTENESNSSHLSLKPKHPFADGEEGKVKSSTNFFRFKMWKLFCWALVAAEIFNHPLRPARCTRWKIKGLIIVWNFRLWETWNLLDFKAIYSMTAKVFHSEPKLQTDWQTENFNFKNEWLSFSSLVNQTQNSLYK